MLSPSIIDQLERAPNAVAQADVVMNAIDEQVTALGDLLVFVSLLAAEHPETQRVISERLDQIGFHVEEDDDHPAERIRPIIRRRRRR